MQKLFLYFIALFVLFFACTPDQPESDTENTTLSVSANTPVAEDLPVATPIPPPDVPVQNIKAVEQAPKKDLVYPKQFLKFKIPKFTNSKVENNTMVDNSQGKYGQRVKLDCSASFEKVNDFYAKELVKNGWVKNDAMDKSFQEEDIRHFSTNYMRDEEKYTLMLAITKGGVNNVSTVLLLKEN
ncbi:MAG: hypothetical protein ACI8P3_003359 [Saprospiraceae bacterium]|jgi:hypothetical protein